MTKQEESTKAKQTAAAKERNRKRTAAQLESQDDLGYLMGPHKAEDARKQIKSPAAQPPEGEEKTEEAS